MRELAATAAVLAVVVLWGALSGRLQRADLSAPIFFVAVGTLFDATGVLDLGDLPDLAVGIRTLAEVTLALVLFSDASRVRVAQLREDAGLYARLLGIGLPLTIGFGGALAAALYGWAPSAWLLLLVGAALAPTDAALGVPVVTNQAVPARVRRALNVESGLNDGIATPVVSAAVAGAAAAEAVAGAAGVGRALLSLLLGLIAGVIVGGGGGAAIRAAQRRQWIAEDSGGPTVLALALLAYTAALVVEGNGFVAAFVAGLAFRFAVGRGTAEDVSYVEQTGGALSYVVWLLFGAVIVPVVIDTIDWRMVIYAVLSLTVVRMAAVALALVGSGFARATVAFMGWFGPRGLASVVFALIAVEDLGPSSDEAVAFIGLTVLFSVVAHGVTAAPVSARYAASWAAHRPAEAQPRAEMPVRRMSGAGREQ